MTLFKKLKWLPFTDELKRNKCCMVVKSLNELAPSYVLFGRWTDKRTCLLTILRGNFILICLYCTFGPNKYISVC